MGTFKVPVTIVNPKEEARKVTLDLLVDTRTAHCVVPAGVLQGLGVVPRKAQWRCP